MGDLIVDALATFRLTRLAVSDELTRPARDRLLARLGPNSRWSYLMTCPWCISAHLGLAVAVLRHRRLWRPIGRALAYSAVAGMLAERFG